MTAAVEMRGVHKWFGALHVLKGVDLAVAAGERIVICGPSGSGKSTLVRCINGLEPFQSGDVLVRGAPLTDDARSLQLVRRAVGMVFQQFNLFPHLTVLENLCLAPVWAADVPREDAEARAKALLERVHIPGQTHSTQLQPARAKISGILIAFSAPYRFSGSRSTWIALRSAPAASRRATVLACPFVDAQCKAVLPLLSLPFTSAPASSRTGTRSSFPFRAASPKSLLTSLP